MPFHSRIFQLAKDLEHPEENQDAYALDAAGGIAVVADGVASAIFSRQWAQILVEAVLADPPDPNDPPAFATWLARQRTTWSEQIDTDGLAWFQKAKLPLGAFSTLLWVRLLPVDQPQEGAFGACRLLAHAVGDGCLLHVRHGEVLRTFPIQDPAELEADPVVVGSVDLQRDQLVEFRTLDVLCCPDDLLVLCTDAIADWALRTIAAGKPPAWDAYWEMTPPQWQAEVVRWRDRREMRYDDATLMLLRVAAEGEEVGQEEDSPVEAEVVQPQDSPSGRRSQPDPSDEGPAAAEEDWKEKFKSASQQFAEGVELASGRIARGWKKWKEKAARKYRKRSKPDDQ
jgi:hypothetical protein